MARSAPLFSSHPPENPFRLLARPLKVVWRMNDRANLWSIVLAAGEGRRMAKLTRALYGREVPKQFAALDDSEQSFLQRTMSRVGRLVAQERTLVVVSNEFEGLARQQLAQWPNARLVLQPKSAGTLPGLLLPLSQILAEDPAAKITVFPSDHHIKRLSPFLDAVQTAIEGTSRAPSRTVLVGAAADRPATDLGWIVPRGLDIPPDGLALVADFVEKPAQHEADRLFRAGGMWNTLVFAAEGLPFWQSVTRECPEVARAFRDHGESLQSNRDANRPAAVRRLYDKLPVADLSRDFLEQVRGLAVVQMKDAGWSDCGTPERLFACLETDALHGLKLRLNQATSGDTSAAFGA